ncbi:MAG: metallophosphoesterase [Oscillospiraceae bacterium]|nr:metallophosphoesterase [Oscillospiraceae bacterium]
MKLLVLSDSHTDTEAIFSAARREQPDMAVHLGDHARDALALRARFPRLPLRFVRGNCDFGIDCADEELFEVCGKKVFITHGHLYTVKSGLDAVTRRGASLGADIVLFGHTHRAYIAQAGGMVLMNPGAAGGRRGWDRDRTYGIVAPDGPGIHCELREA